MRKALLWLTFALALIGGPPAFAAVTLNAQGAAITYTASTLTISDTNLTIAAGSNIVLVYELDLAINTVTPTCNWDAAGTPQAMTLIGSANNSGLTAQLYGLVNPHTGNKTLTCTWATTSTNAAVYGTSWNGANQTGGATTFPNFTSATGTSTTANVAGTAPSSGVAIDSATNNTANLSAPTQISLVNNNANSIDVAQSYATSSVTFQWTVSASSPWVDVATGIAPAGGGGAAKINNSMLLMGAGP
ncbi:MAG: hypothetical protein KGL39_05275 [Patescibacteria group bacterium]|nr:hypothetical protein [Patescibacteria group bacterium]